MFDMFRKAFRKNKNIVNIIDTKRLKIIFSYYAWEYSLENCGRVFLAEWHVSLLPMSLLGDKPRFKSVFDPYRDWPERTVYVQGAELRTITSVYDHIVDE